MKNYSRAYNRHKKQMKFVKRVKIWVGYPDQNGERENEINLTLQGKHFLRLRTTNRPCNCSMCIPYLKHKRPSKCEVKKMIDESIDC